MLEKFIRIQHLDRACMSLLPFASSSFFFLAGHAASRLRQTPLKRETENAIWPTCFMLGPPQRPCLVPLDNPAACRIKKCSSPFLRPYNDANFDFLPQASHEEAATTSAVEQEAPMKEQEGNWGQTRPAPPASLE